MISGSSTTESSIAPSACKSTPLLTLTPQIWSTPNQSSGAGSAEKKPACSDALDRMAFKLSFPPEPDFWFYFFCFLFISPLLLFFPFYAYHTQTLHDPICQCQRKVSPATWGISNPGRKRNCASSGRLSYNYGTPTAAAVGRRNTHGGHPSHQTTPIPLPPQNHPDGGSSH